MSPELAQGCRDLAVQQAGSYLRYSGRGASAYEKAARDPIRIFEADIPWGSAEAVKVLPSDEPPEQVIADTVARCAQLTVRC